MEDNGCTSAKSFACHVSNEHAKTLEKHFKHASDPMPLSRALN